MTRKNDKFSHQKALITIKKHYTKRFLSSFFIIFLLINPNIRAAQLLDEQNRSWDIAIMQTDADKARGLMYRLYLHPWQGMLFLYDRPQTASFWMYHTYTPLAITFYDAYGRLLTHYPHAAPCYHANPAYCPIYPAHALIKYVLETRPAQQNLRIPYAPAAPPQRLVFIKP